MSSVLAKHEAPTETTAAVVLADVSGSMEGNRIRRLRDWLNRHWADAGARLISFSYTAAWRDGPDDLPEPDGGTDLAAALKLAATVFPSTVLVLSDGRPVSERAALAAARLIPGTISTVFLGDDNDVTGREFMERLAALGGGKFTHRNIAKHASLESDSLRSMLALEPPIAL